MAVTTTKTNKPLNPRGNDQSPKGYNRAELYTGKALDFDGVNDNISFPLFTFSTGNKYTLCIYANRDNNGMIWSRDNQWIEVRFTSGALELRTYNNGLAAWSTYTLIDDVPANEWHQIIVTYDVDANLWKSYLNGQFIKSVTAEEPSNKHINRIGSSASTFYDGEFANAKIFEVELTAAQVADLYNNPEKIVPTGVADSALKLWLPMMEGAGTTAYDGSGNGNHGTISGATWTHGVGSPVAQTAVIDWNKGTNELPESNGFVEADLNFAYQSSSETEATITAPDGSTDAFEYICDAVTTTNQFVRINPNTTYTSGQVYTYSLFVKYNTKQFVKLAYMNYAGNNYFVAAFDLINGTITDTNSAGTAANTNSFIEEAPNGWYRIGIIASLTSSAGQAMNFEFNVIPSGTPTWSTYGRVNQTTTTSDKVYIYGASLIEGEQGPYVHTIGTAQTSDVLLPAGLTTGRDITGVNLFENVRKQGALNLDGNSWAEVHDNASLDITSAITLEAWIDNTNAYDSIRYLFDKSDNSTNGFELRLTSQNGVQIVFRSLSTISKVATIPTSGWVHVVATYDGANIKMYIDGSLKNTTASTGTITANDYPLTIGGDVQNSNYSLNKPIAQPRIYDRALTAEEVERNYDAGKNIYK